MRFYAPIAKVDAEQRMVWGYASTEALDEQGEVVSRDALAAALDDYMKFANIREMHQMSAVGVAEAAALDDKGLYVAARVVDERAWEKIRGGVYKGFSIGGKVKARDPADRRVITELALSEISLVDRPANPEAVFDCWKRAAPDTAREGTPAMPFNPPLQFWFCGIEGHHHLAKADALRCREGDTLGKAETAAHPAIGEDRGEREAEYADPGYQSDGKKRYPIDSEPHIRAAWTFIHRARNAARYKPAELVRIKERIVAAWRGKIDRAGPPEAGEKASSTSGLRKGLEDVGRVAEIVLDLDWLSDNLALEAAMEGDNSSQPERLQAIIGELCAFLRAMVMEEAGEIVVGDQIAQPVPELALAAGAHTEARALAKAEALFAAERAQSRALLETLTGILPRLDRLAKRVEDIAATPLPPLTVGRAVSSISKWQDGGTEGTAALSPDLVAAAFANMSEEEQTLTLIKAAHANPIRPFAPASMAETRSGIDRK
ncbi:MAG TPA: DUF6582 domain-containing protein [Stellaceae bacterium]|nr:DUF6582 domain-containing protein [Stellaceae bacterium]